MKKGLVNLAQGTPEQLNKLKTFLLNVQTKSDTRLKTHADAVMFAIDQAERVPELEKMVKELEKVLAEMEDKYHTTLQSISKIDVDMKGENR